MTPRIPNDPMYQLLRDGNIKEFNDRRASGETVNLANCDFRSVDLRGLEAHGLDMHGSYFRQADLRGIDFSKTKINGASLNNAHISGTLFPASLSAQEILLSVQLGTRLRCADA